jgi:hypothetical protein
VSVYVTLLGREFANHNLFLATNSNLKNKQIPARLHCHPKPHIFPTHPQNKQAQVAVSLGGVECVALLCGLLHEHQHQHLSASIAALASAANSKTQELKLAALKTTKTLAKQMPKVRQCVCVFVC